MQELKKILEEIEMKKKKCLDIVRVEIDPMEITIHREQYKGLRMAEDIIRNHMNDGWIPVEEGLPEDTESGFYNAVNVTMSNGSVTHGCYRNADGEWWVAREDGEFKYTQSDEVIAWSPLPESYCPERSDNHDRE